MSKTTIQVPKDLLRGFLEAGQRFNTVEDELEDFLLATNQDFIKEMRRLKKAHHTGRSVSRFNLAIAK